MKRSGNSSLADIGIAAATLAAVTLLCWVGAYWFWRWMTSSPTAPARTPMRGDWARAIADARFFGVAPAPMADASPATQFKLLGVVTEHRGGYALIRLPDQTTKLVAVGKEIAAGVTIERIENDRVFVRDHGRNSTVILRETKSAPVVVAAPGQAAPSGAASRCPLAPEDLARAYILHSELLDGVARDPRSWNTFLRAQDGALQVGSDAGVGKLLGLEPLDRLERSNGVQLASVDDLTRAFIRPLQQDQALRVTGTRKGKAMEWVYVNAAACIKGR